MRKFRMSFSFQGSGKKPLPHNLQNSKTPSSESNSASLWETKLLTVNPVNLVWKTKERPTAQ